MEKLQIAIPWNNCSYMPCNGFHPLYQSIFDNAANQNITLNVLDEPAFFESLTDPNQLQKTLTLVDEFSQIIRKKWLHFELSKKLVDTISAEDLWITTNLPGDLELHHTCPLTSTERPFVFHCESFLPIFMPFAYQGAGAMKNPEAIRDFYLSILSGDNCLGIYSHIQTTLDQISYFFKDPKIDAKLSLTKIGLSGPVYTELTQHRRNEFPQTPIFLFTSSAHQQPVSFRVRGGYSVLSFAIQYLRQNKPALFIFRCGRPNDVDLEAFGIDIEFVRLAEKNQQIIWIEGFLPENEQLALFKIADFFLMPSLNLHSVSIMQAQTAGAIPVVTDTCGVEAFVANHATGIVLRGVRSAVWETDPVIGIEFDDHKRWTPELASLLASQLYDRIVDILDNPNTFLKLRNNMRSIASTNYSGAQFREELFADLLNKWADRPRLSKIDKHRINKKLPLIDFNNPISHQLFESPPVQKQMLTLENGRVFYLKGNYWYYPNLIDLSTYFSWSPLSVAKNGFMGSKGVKIKWELEHLREHLLPLQDLDNSSSIMYLEEFFRKFLLRFPIIRKLFNPLIPTIKSILKRIELLSASHDGNISTLYKLTTRLIRKSPTLTRIARTSKSLIIQLARNFPTINRILTTVKFARILFSSLLRLSLNYARNLIKTSRMSLLSFYAKLTHFSSESDTR